MAFFLGVDLGTTFTAAGLVRGGEPGHAEPVTLGTNGVAVPSVVYLDGDRVVVGDPAARRAATEPTQVAREFKRRLGDSTPMLLDGRPVAADALMGRLLEWVVGEVASSEGAAPAGLAVTHPANWGEFKLDLLRQAARHAGATVDHLVPEPVAAASFYASQRDLPPGAVVAVYDLGGGTFDAAVVRADPTGFRTIGQPDGIERLGGTDFDEAVLGHVARSLGVEPAGMDLADPATAAGLVRLREACVDAKEALSAETDVAIPVMLPGLHTQVRLTRTELETMVRPALEDTLAALVRTIASAGLAPDDVDTVLLVGGSSRIPLVAQLVMAQLGRPIAVDARPKDAICLGAALVAADAAARAPSPSPPPTETHAPASPAPVAPAPAPRLPPEVQTPTPDGMPPRSKSDAEPPSAKRTPLLVALAVLLVMAVGGVTMLILGGNGTDPDQTGPFPGPDEPTGSDGDALALAARGACPNLRPGAGQGLVVRECGYSTFGSGPDGLGTVGFVVENTGTADLTSIDFEVTFVDAEGETVRTTGMSLSSLRAGDSMGIGQAVESPGFDRPIGEIRIAADATRCREDTCQVPDEDVTASDVSVEVDDTGMETSFEVEAGHPDEAGTALVYLIFRDPAGAIVGGHTGTVDLAAEDTTGGSVTAPGVLDIDYDDPSVEVHLDPLVGQGG